MSVLSDKIDSLKILWYFFRPHKSRTVTVFLMMIISSFFESLNLAALYPIINYGLQLEVTNKGLKFLERIISVFGHSNLFVSSCILLIVLTVMATILRIIYSFCANKLIVRITSENQNAIFEKYLKADYDFFVESQQGKLVYAGTVAPIGVSSNIFYAIRIVNSLTTSLFFTVLLIVLAWQGTTLILLVSALYVFLVRKVTKQIVNRYAHLSVDEDRKKNVILNEFITGVKTIKIFLNLEYWKKKYAGAVENSALYNFIVMMGRVLPDSSLKFIFFVVFALIGIFLNFKQAGNILPAIPLLGTFAMVAIRLIPYVNLAGNDIVALARFMPDTKIVYNVLHQDMNRIDGTRVFDGFKSDITFKDVWFKHKDMANFLLGGVTFTVHKSKMTAIVGPSGSGKSTIINLLLRLYDIEKGQITIDGVDIREFSAKSYLPKFGYVSQETFIFNETIKENIRFGMENCDEAAIIEAAKLANAHDFILETQDGYDTVVGDAGMKLSGGQRQRIAIARAILRKPQIIVLDEATSSLDNISERHVQEAINNISQQATVLTIAHRLSTVQNADKIIVLEQGKIVEIGTHKDLLRSENTYFNLYKNS